MQTDYSYYFSILERFSEKLPDIEFAWIGGKKTIKKIKALGRIDFSKQEAKNIVQQYDFMITLGSADANPTTILEAMAWGLIPVCSVQSGYQGFIGIQNISIECIDDSVKTIKFLQSVPEEELKIWQQKNLNVLDNHFNWERFCTQVLKEIENENILQLVETDHKNRLFLFFAEFSSPSFWLRPSNFYKYITTNINYIIRKTLQKMNNFLE